MFDLKESNLYWHEYSCPIRKRCYINASESPIEMINIVQRCNCTICILERDSLLDFIFNIAVYRYRNGEDSI